MSSDKNGRTVPFPGSLNRLRANPPWFAGCTLSIRWLRIEWTREILVPSFVLTDFRSFFPVNGEN